ncbi:hypothetical protein [Paraburkholderia diazotrophica]|uniref:Uncharacterized protein n=1 Tax=Paraburkholderia diazotrophica TaxID=667676 RepID=A0A1H6XZB4_9BURK|nr:hypothetical protein [Paraburkholderia diazotrophica]SEJ33526.1 hypothetical protein SAMN05192539_1009138 [Paraburkholderia diazotrophica]
MESKPSKQNTDKLRQPAGVAQPVPERDTEKDTGKDTSKDARNTDKAAGRTPGGNNLNAIPEKDVDEVVPVSPDETKLRDPALTPDDEDEKRLDPSGNRRRPL